MCRWWRGIVEILLTRARRSGRSLLRVVWGLLDRQALRGQQGRMERQGFRELSERRGRWDRLGRKGLR